ncbi:M48 family metallopeptidase [Desertivirga arenae]|uniref:M48 family metallopeptidase n=1 Tax=Desertivirga arenae TaxID=2810309 RepID=UPI001A97864D|nr:M48 family metallopeptidase [Pedobacter sp. SYSU D00823]
MSFSILCRALGGFLIAVFYSIPSHAQVSSYYPFFLKDSTQVNALAKTVSGSVDASYSMPLKIKGDYRKHFNALKENAVEEVADLVKYTALLDTVLDPFLQKTFRRLQATEPLAKNSRLIVTRSYIDNAFATGDGTVFINAGLIASLRNEDQLAFVIAHELAHGIMNHVQKNISNYLGSLYDKDLQAEYSKIIKNGYNTNKRVKALLMKVSSNNLYHRRKDESAADSMAFYILKRAGYDPAEAYNALKIFDLDPLASSSVFEKQAEFFSCIENWKRTPENTSAKSIFNVKAEVVDTPDSLKTHPDCKVRMAAVRNLLLETGRDTTAELLVSNDPGFKKVKILAQYEAAQAMFDNEYFDKSLYTALCGLDPDNESPYLKSIAILSLLQLKSYMQGHKYSEAVSNSSDHNPKDVNNFVEFLNALSLSDFKKLKESFDKRYGESKAKDEFSLMASFSRAHIDNNSQAAGILTSEYRKLYPSGRFIGLLKSFNYIKSKK